MGLWGVTCRTQTGHFLLFLYNHSYRWMEQGNSNLRQSTSPDNIHKASFSLPISQSPARQIPKASLNSHQQQCSWHLFVFGNHIWHNQPHHHFSKVVYAPGVYSYGQRALINSSISGSTTYSYGWWNSGMNSSISGSTTQPGLFTKLQLSLHPVHFVAGWGPTREAEHVPPACLWQLPNIVFIAHYHIW